MTANTTDAPIPDANAASKTAVNADGAAANLPGANLSGASLSGANLSGASVAKMSVTDLGVWRLLRADLRYLGRKKSRNRLRVCAVALTNRGFHALVLHRLAHALTKRKIPLLPLILSRVSQTLFGVDIDPQAQLGPAIVIVHGFGIVIGNEVIIGGECVLFHGVTLGNKGTEWVPCDDKDGQPVVGKNCILSAGAKILGPISVGDHCIVGANAVVIKDVAEGQIVGGVPARILNARPPLGCISYMKDWID